MIAAGHGGTGTTLHPTTVKKIARELQALQAQPLEGIRIQFREEDLGELLAFILGPDGTPYTGGCFKIRMQFTPDYPNAPPKCYFITKIFHPNVSKTGEICVSTLKKDWKKDLGIAHILLTIKCLLIVPNAESALNEEAGKLLLEAYDDYAQRARLMTNIHANNKAEYRALAEHDSPSSDDHANKDAKQQDREQNSLKTDGVTDSKTSSEGNDAKAGKTTTENEDDKTEQKQRSEESENCAPTLKRTAVADAKKKADAKKRSLKRL